jgi:hypothetical protein
MSRATVEEWHACQRRVTELELQYAEQMVRYCRAEGPAPDDDLRTRMLAMRREAAALLSKALGEVDQRMNDADAELWGQISHCKGEA